MGPAVFLHVLGRGLLFGILVDGHGSITDGTPVVYAVKLFRIGMAYPKAAVEGYIGGRFLNTQGLTQDIPQALSAPLPQGLKTVVHRL